MKCNFLTFICFIAFLPLILALVFGFKQYQIWPQITYLYERNASPIEQLLILSPHSFRYTALYPLLYLSDIMNISSDHLYSLMAIIIGYLTVNNIIQSSRLICADNLRRDYISTSLVSILVVVVLFGVNGRGCMTLFGYSLLVRTLLESELKKHYILTFFLKILISFIFICVSSGTLMIGMVTTLIYLIYKMNYIAKRMLKDFMLPKKIHQVLSMFVVILIFLLIAFVGLMKNLKFYGGGFTAIVEMLEHGFGAIFITFVNYFGATLLIIMVVTLIITILIFLKTSNFPQIIGLIITCLGLGAFGYSTAAMVIIPSLILLAVKARHYHL